MLFALFVFIIPILLLQSISNILRSSNVISNCGFLAIFIHLTKLSLVGWFVFTVILVIKCLSQCAALLLGGIDSTRCQNHSRDFGPYHSQLHIRDIKLPFLYALNVPYWIEICGGCLSTLSCQRNIFEIIWALRRFSAGSSHQ